MQGRNNESVAPRGRPDKGKYGEVMLPNMRTVLVTLAAAFMAVSVGLGLMTSSRSASVFAIGLRSAQGSPVSSTLPEPPEWKQSAARAAERRAEELERLLDLFATEPARDPADPEITGTIPSTAPPSQPTSPPDGAAQEPPLHPQ
jgi:hypothetical protein